MSPVAGSIATTAPSWVPSALRASACTCGTSVVITFPPRFGRPRMMSVRFWVVNSGAVPAR